MAKKPEKLCPGTKPGYKKFVKKQTVKYERRRAKAELDDAPKKRTYRGWST